MPGPTTSIGSLRPRRARSWTRSRWREGSPNGDSGYGILRCRSETWCAHSRLELVMTDTGNRLRVLVLDNYDSFTYNLVQYLGELGAEIEVVRNDQATVPELLIRGYDRVIVSPGPCTPDQAGISLEAVRRFPVARIPTLGVCLGHQALVQAWGGRVVRHEPVHGKTSDAQHDGRTIFRGLRDPLQVGRYHSLVAHPELPACLERSAVGGE